MDEMNRIPEEQNIEELKKQEATTPPNAEENAPATKMPAPKAPVPKILFIVGGIILAVVAIAILVVVFIGGGGSHEHKFGEWITTKNPTCTDNGVKTRYCDCGEKQNDIIPSDGHSFGNWEETIPATCRDEGEMITVCTICQAEKHSVIPITDAHTLVTDKAISATCTAYGLTEGSHCSICEKVLVAQIELPKASHKYDNDFDATCNNCSFTRPIDCRHSNTKTLQAKDPTCTEAGLTEGKVCVNCEDVLIKQEILEPLEHDWKEATCTNPKTCQRTGCGATDGRANGHSFSEWVTVKEATTTKEGLKERTCSCGEKETEDIPVVTAYVRDGDYIYFGEYPQSIKADDVTITETQDSRGYYLGSDGFYYAMVTAFPYDTDYTFSTGSTIRVGRVYYFKVEPIRWRILSEEDGEAFLLCDSIIAAVQYQTDLFVTSAVDVYTTANGAPSGTYAENYKYSTVRAWLNSTFYKNAFTALQQATILTTEVDNSLASTGSWYNPYVCENTNDKLFLLSNAEATNSSYGFSSDRSENDSVRRLSTSDYSRATGVKMDTSSDYYGNGSWLMRSPNSSGSVCEVDTDGQILDYYDTPAGGVPALRIRLIDENTSTYVRCDKDGTENVNGDYILFGEYPQTLKADDVTITETQDSRGYYLGSDGFYYAKVLATPNGTAQTFSTGVSIKDRMVYYFKVEPIRWRILSEEDGEAFLLCDSIIAAVAYNTNCYYYDPFRDSYTTSNGAPSGTYANNYKYSTVRAWLTQPSMKQHSLNIKESMLYLLQRWITVWQVLAIQAIHIYARTHMTRYFCFRTQK